MGKAERCGTGIHGLGEYPRLRCGEWLRDNRAAGAKVAQYAGSQLPARVAGNRPVISRDVQPVVRESNRERERERECAWPPRNRRDLIFADNRGAGRGGGGGEGKTEDKDERGTKKAVELRTRSSAREPRRLVVVRRRGREPAG